MASSTDLRHRALPALIMLLALILLAAIVWWRVLDRGTGTTHHTAARCPTTAPSAPSQPATLPAPSAVDVTVLNATDRNGLAGSVRDRLRKRGFVSSKPAGDWPTAVPGIGQVRYTPADRAAATLLGYYLPGATLVATRATTATGRAQVTVVLGNRYRALAAPAAVQQSIDRYRSSTTTPGPTPSSRPATSSSPAASSSCR